MNEIRERLIAAIGEAFRSDVSLASAADAVISELRPELEAGIAALAEE